MKIIALGDIHGRNSWQQIVTKEHFDKLIFIGDYFDSHEGIRSTRQKDNFKDIMTYKERNPDKTVLLIGNHDFHYLKNVNETYSGYQEEEGEAIQAMLQPAVDEGLLQMCFTWENLLFTHAGVTQTWCRNNCIQADHPAKAINELFKTKSNAFAFTSGIRYDPFGDEVEQTPIWVRPQSLLNDKLKNWIQVVGHTVQSKLERINDVFFIDTLGTSGEYFIWEDGEIGMGKVDNHEKNYSF